MNLFLICFFIFHECHFSGFPEGKWFYCFFLAEYNFNLGNLEYLLQIELINSLWGKSTSMYLYTIPWIIYHCCSVALSYPTLWLHEFQHARRPCLSLSPRVCSDSCPLSCWCYPTIYLILCPLPPFSSCLQSFPASWYFSMNWHFMSGAQNTGASELLYCYTILHVKKVKNRCSKREKIPLIT